MTVSTVEHPTEPQCGPLRPTRAAAAPADVLARLAAGDAAAWSRVTAEYRPRLCAVGRAFRLHAHDVDDALQRTWLALLTHAAEIRDVTCLGSWLTTTMRRECLTLLRRREDPVGDWATYADRCVGPDEAAALLETLDERRLAGELWHLVDQLPARQRCLLQVLFGPDEPSYAEVSARTGLPVGAIGPTRQRALHRLRELYQRRQPAPVAA